MDKAEITAYVEQHTNLVWSCVRKVQRRSPVAVDVDVLFQEGMKGLLVGLSNYNPKKNFNFCSYILPCIAGQIISYLRDIDPLPRTRRDLLKEADAMRRWYVRRFQDEPSDTALATLLGTDLVTYQSVQDETRYFQFLHFEDSASANEHEADALDRQATGDYWGRTTSDSEELVSAEQRRQIIMNAIAALNPIEQEYIVRHYYDGERFTTINEDRDCSIVTGWKYHKSALAKLRVALSHLN